MQMWGSGGGCSDGWGLWGTSRRRGHGGPCVQGAGAPLVPRPPSPPQDLSI